MAPDILFIRHLDLHLLFSRAPERNIREHQSLSLKARSEESPGPP
jgi:hypothetical protein